jgi:hypothetical protein
MRYVTPRATNQSVIDGKGDSRQIIVPVATSESSIFRKATRPSYSSWTALASSRVILFNLTFPTFFFRFCSSLLLRLFGASSRTAANTLLLRTAGKKRVIRVTGLEPSCFDDAMLSHSKVFGQAQREGVVSVQ